jgi:hypothetical protein
MPGETAAKLRREIGLARTTILLIQGPEPSSIEIWQVVVNREFVLSAVSFESRRCNASPEETDTRTSTAV